MKKLNLGCGPHAMPGWLNYDINGARRMDVVPIDLSLGQLPHVDESVDFIFSEHFIEHLTREQGLKLLRECYRVMKPGAVMRLSTPDLRDLVKRYRDGELHNMPGVWEPKTPAQMLNEGMRLWGHQFLYDGEELAELFIEAGFDLEQDLGERVEWRQSNHEALRGLEVRPDHGDLIVEITKPARPA